MAAPASSAAAAPLGERSLRDKDLNDIDPFLNAPALDISRGNSQIAHGIVLVLRPLDL